MCSHSVKQPATKTLDIWTSIIRPEWDNSPSKTSSTWSPQFLDIYRLLLKEKGMLLSGNMDLRRDVHLTWNPNLPFYWFKMEQVLSFTFVYYDPLWICFTKLRLTNHCILFPFTFTQSPKCIGTVVIFGFINGQPGYRDELCFLTFPS